MKAMSYLFLAAGVILLLTHVYLWQTDRRGLPYTLDHLVFPIVPAWSLLIMAWTGLAAENVRKRLRE